MSAHSEPVRPWGSARIVVGDRKRYEAGKTPPMLSLAFRTFEFLVYHVLIVIVDRVSRLPRTSTPPELMRLYRENLALKAQLVRRSFAHGLLNSYDLAAEDAGGGGELQAA